MKFPQTHIRSLSLCFLSIVALSVTASAKPKSTSVPEAPMLAVEPAAPAEPTDGKRQGERLSPKARRARDIAFRESLKDMTPKERSAALRVHMEARRKERPKSQADRSSKERPRMRLSEDTPPARKAYLEAMHAMRDLPRAEQAAAREEIKVLHDAMRAEHEAAHRPQRTRPQRTEAPTTEQ